KDLARTTPRRLAEMQVQLDPRLPAQLITSSPTAAAAGSTIVATNRVPHTGRAGAASEIRREPGQKPWHTRRLNEFSTALAADGADLVSGEIAVLIAPNAHYDVRPQRPTLSVSADRPTPRA